MVITAMKFDKSYSLVSECSGSARASRAGFAAPGETYFPLLGEMTFNSSRWRERHRRHAGARALPGT